MIEQIISVKFVTVTVTFFLLMDGLGNIPIFVSLLKNLSPKRQVFIIARESLIALVAMLFFALCGDFVLKHLGIKNQTIQIAGGIILFMIAIKMIFSNSNHDIELEKDEPFIVPLAIPLVAGPSVLATIMIYSKDPLIQTIVIPSVVVAWLFTTVILLLSTPIKSFLGEKGIVAVEKLMGLILTLIAVQLFLDGLYTFLHT